jgi:hypothetical protein
MNILNTNITKGPVQNIYIAITYIIFLSSQITALSSRQASKTFIFSNYDFMFACWTII